MARPLRIEFPDAVYHVMNRGIAHQSIYLDRSDYKKFLYILSQASIRWDLQVFAFALMQNHYHLCLKTPQGNLSRVMRHINGVYTQEFNRLHERDGPLFRGRYKAILIDDEHYLGAVVRYIHLNPVKAGLCKDPKSYEWSSHRIYLEPGLQKKWLNCERLLNYFEGSRGFHEYVIKGNDKSITGFYEKKRQGLILGEDVFINYVRNKSVKVSKDHVREDIKYVRDSKVDLMLEKVSSIYNISRKSIMRGKRGSKNTARNMSIFLAHRLCDLRQIEIAKLFGLTSPGTVGHICFQISHKVFEDKRTKEIVHEISQELKSI